MFAAQALTLHGIEPAIISKKKKSVIYGAQYLHTAIPELSSPDPEGHVKTMRAGTRERYAERVYGDAQHVTSWDRVRPEVPAWDLRKTYDRAWEKYEHKILEWTVSGQDIEEFTAQFDLVISTIPLWSICMKPREHTFNSVPILVKQGVDFDGAELLHVMGPNWVVYNGSEDGYKWYRASRIFGHTSAEAPADTRLHLEGWSAGFKVVSNTCTCHPNVVRAGRMGLWTAGVLTHHAFHTTLDSIAHQFGSMQLG